MSLRNFIGTATMTLASMLVGAAGYLLYSAQYRLALAATVAIVLCMELRVRMGWRLPRARMFMLHILAGVLLLVSLSLLAWKPMPPWVLWGATALLVGVALGGGSRLAKQALKRG